MRLHWFSVGWQSSTQATGLDIVDSVLGKSKACSHFVLATESQEINVIVGAFKVVVVEVVVTDFSGIVHLFPDSHLKRFSSVTISAGAGLMAECPEVDNRIKFGEWWKPGGKLPTPLSPLNGNSIKWSGLDHEKKEKKRKAKKDSVFHKYKSDYYIKNLT